MTEINDVIRLQIYVEGVLLPSAAWSSFSVTSQERGSATAGMRIFPLPGFRAEELARARVQAFWSNIDIRERHGDDWPMMFDGEIIADGFSKSPTSRDVNVRMIGQDVYFDQCKLYYYNLNTAANVMNGSTLAMLFGNDNVEISVNNPGLDTVNRVVDTIRGAVKDRPSAPLPSLVRDVFKSTLSSNYYLQRTRQQIKLDQRFAVPKDDFAALLYSKRELFFTQIENGVAVRDGDTPIREVLEDVLAVFRYQMICNPAPTMLSSELVELDPITGQRETILAGAETMSLRLFGVPPSKIAIDENTNDNEIAVIADTLANPMTRANLYPGATLNVDAVELLGDLEATPADVIEFMDQARPKIKAALLMIRNELKRATSVNTSRTSVEVIDEDPNTKDRLAQFLLLPDTTFAAVPRCNIIFPNEYSSYRMSRDHLREPTRLIQFVPTVADAENQVFYAPENLGTEARLVIDAVSYTGTFKAFPPVLVGGKEGIKPLITSQFGLRTDPTKKLDNQSVESGTLKLHKGVDIGVPKGTPVFAVLDGTCFIGRQERGAGLHVTMQHAGNDFSKYFHLSSVAVKEGQVIAAGTQLGLSGGDPKDTDTAGSSTGPHLHFELCRGGRYAQVDPVPFLLEAQNELKKSVSNASVIGKSSSTASEAAVVETMAIASQKATANTASGERFSDHRYLTPEEEIRGIVPIIDTSMDRTAMIYSLAAGTGSRDNYLKMITLSNFHKARYASRSFDAIPMSFTPRVMAGFPVLVMDNFRSVIAMASQVTHEYHVGGSATTTVVPRDPRHWDEGDPYFWRDGKEAYLTVSDSDNNDNDGAKQPDPASANFPGYLLPSMFPTNSYTLDPSTSSEPIGGSKTNRPEDLLYLSMIGCRAAPYSYASRTSPVHGAQVSYNQAIPTLLNHYNAMASLSHEAANRFVEEYTARNVVRRDEYFQFLGCVPGAGGYLGPAFRDTLRAVVLQYVGEVSGSDAFRG